jgi:hypothetical protein
MSKQARRTIILTSLCMAVFWAGVMAFVWPEAALWIGVIAFVATCSLLIINYSGGER